MGEACYKRSYCVRLDLQKEEHSRINKFLNRLGEDGDIKNTAFIRAMLFYMDSAEMEDGAVKQNPLEERLSSLEERIEKIEGCRAPDGKMKEHGKKERQEMAAEGDSEQLSPEDEAEIGEIARGFM